MKVWEILRNLKSADSNKEGIMQWAYMNRIVPLDFERELDLGLRQKYPKRLNEIAKETNDLTNDPIEWLDMFLESNVV